MFEYNSSNWKFPWLQYSFAGGRRKNNCMQTPLLYSYKELWIPRNKKFQTLWSAIIFQNSLRLRVRTMYLSTQSSSVFKWLERLCCLILNLEVTNKMNTAFSCIYFTVNLSWLLKTILFIYFLLFKSQFLKSNTINMK